MTTTHHRTVSSTLLCLFFALVTLLVLGGFIMRTWLPPVASDHGVGVDRVIQYQIITTGVIFLIGHVVLLWFIWGSTGGAPKPYTRPSRKAEWGWALVPVILMTLVAEVGVIFIGAPVWTKIYGDAPEDAFEVEVVGMQFAWIVRYPGPDGQFGRVEPARISDANLLGLDPDDPASKDDYVVYNDLHLPKDRCTVVRLRSHDVLHSFTIPEFRVKQDIVPGYTGSAQFTATVAGKYDVACAELCGLGHYQMKGLATVHEPAEFQQWLDETYGIR